MFRKSNNVLTSLRIKPGSALFSRFDGRYFIMINLFFTPLLLCSVSYAMQEKKPFVSPTNSDLDTFFTLTPSDSLNFKTLTIGSDNKTLFIGARQRVYGQQLDDIRSPAFPPVIWEGENLELCMRRPQNDGKCHNQIQVIQQLNDTHVVICGSNMMISANRFLIRQDSKSDFTLANPQEYKRSLCSPDPNQSVTSTAVDNGGQRVIVSTQVTDTDPIALMKSMPDEIFYSTTAMKGSRPEFAASFYGVDSTSSHMMDKIYMVSYEMANEMYPNRPEPKPTITQVCANDVGGQNLLALQWTSLLKLRLVCATTDDEYPLSFNLVTDMVRGGNDILYGTFMTMYKTSRSNAVCSFRLADIQEAFHGTDFWNTETSTYSKNSANKLKPYYPGMCAYPGMDPKQPKKSTSKDFPEEFLKFMSYSFLVVGEVRPAFPPGNASDTSLTQGPLFIKAGEKFSKIAVQQVVNLTGSSHDVMFVGKENGQIHKFVCIEKNNKIETIELASYRPTTDPILSMVLSQEKGQLYIGTEHSLYQISTANCAAYTKSCEFCDPCHMCVLSRDPGCGWDIDTKECISIEDGLRSNIRQDIYYGDAAAQCPAIDQNPPPSLKGVSNGDTVILGDVITNPTVTTTWYKYNNAVSSAKKRILESSTNYRIKVDGQLQIDSFNPSSDTGIYECHYSIQTITLNVSSFKISESSGNTPLVIVTPSNKQTPKYPDARTSRLDVVGANETTTMTSVAVANTTHLIIGLVAALVATLIVVLVLFVVFKRRSSKYTPSHRKTYQTSSVLPSPRSKENVSSNNNAGIPRTQSEFDDRANRPLLVPNRTTVQNTFETKSEVAADQRKGRSMGNIVDNRDDLQFADDDSNASLDKPFTQQSSMRDIAGRQRVPPARTKSMPGSSLYVVYAGKKLMCSTLQRSKQGTWTIEVKPSQSAMLDVSTDNDEIIDIVDDDGGKEEAVMSPTPEHASSSSKVDDISKMKNARKAFFAKDSSGSNFDSSRSIQYVSLPPNPTIIQKPKVAPKPPHVLERAASLRKPLSEQSSRASSRNLGQNSSDDRDSDTTIKGSVTTLKLDDAQSPINKSSPYSFNNVTDQQPELSKDSPAEAVVQAPHVAHSISKRSSTKSSSLATSDRLSDRSSGNSDGDEQLHGRDMGIKIPRTPLDSPSKQSRTSNGSSSSADYKSARSSVVSEPTYEHR